MTNPIRSNPNATVGGGSGFGAALVLLAADKLGWTNLTAFEGATISTAVSYVALLIGREGLVGLFRRIWNGAPGA